MEKENLIEAFFKKLSSDKNRLLAVIFSVLSLFCSLFFIGGSSLSALVLIYSLLFLGSAALCIYYALDADSKFKLSNDAFILALGMTLLGIILRIIQLGIIFSVRYFIGYLIFGIAIILLLTKLTSGKGKKSLLIALLIISAAFCIFEFFYIKSIYLPGFFWKIYRFADAFLFLAYIFMLNTVTDFDSFSDKLMSYKTQIPSAKLCLLIFIVIAVISIAIGFIKDLNDTQHTVTSTTVTTNSAQDTKSTENKAKGTVSSADTQTTVQSSENVSSVSEKTIQAIELGQTVETENYDFTLNSVTLSYDVKPANPPSYYTHYPAASGQVFIYVNASVKNKQKQAMDCDEIYSVTADYNNGFEYTGFNITDDTDGDFTYANINSVEPLQTRGVHCLIDCPEEVETSLNPLSLTFNFKDGSQYSYKIR